MTNFLFGFERFKVENCRSRGDRNDSDWLTVTVSAGPTLLPPLIVQLGGNQQRFDLIYGNGFPSTTNNATGGVQRDTSCFTQAFCATAATMSNGLIFTFTLPAPPPPSFDTCLTDNSTGNLLQWNSTTGQYKFTRCSDGFMLAGTGTVGLVNGIRTLTDFKTDRRISAGFNTGQLTGNATIYLMVAQGVWQSFRIVDTNRAAVCACPG